MESARFSTQANKIAYKCEEIYAMQRHFTILHAFYISALFVFTFPAYPVKCREQKNQVKIEVRKEHFLLKKIITILCAVVMALSLFAGCGQKADDNNTAAAGGTVATDGSTSMEKVIGALGESFMEANSGIDLHLQPDRLRLRHPGRFRRPLRHRPVQPRAEGRREGFRPEGDHPRSRRHRHHRQPREPRSAT